MALNKVLSIRNVSTFIRYKIIPYNLTLSFKQVVLIGSANIGYSTINTAKRSIKSTSAILCQKILLYSP